MDTLTYNDCATLLRESGYAPAPARDGRVNGPIRTAQVDWSKHARDTDEAAVLCALPPAFGTASHVIADHVSTWLATITVDVSGPARADVLAAVERVAAGAPVCERDGETVFVFRTSERMELSAHSFDGTDRVNIEQDAVRLGTPADWRDGRTPIHVARAELPELSRDAAQALIDECDELLSKHAPAYVDQYVPKPKFVPADVRLGRDNTDEIVRALRANGYAPVTLPFGDEPGRSERARGAQMPAPAIGVYLKAPSTAGFSFRMSADDHRDTWLTLLTVKTAPKLAADVAALLEPLLASGKRVSRTDGDSTIYLFKHDVGRAQLPFDPIRFSRSRRYADLTAATGTHVSATIECKERAPLVLGAGIAWDALLKVHRDELPPLDHNAATMLVSRLSALLDEPQPAETGLMERAKRAIRGGR